MKYFRLAIIFVATLLIAFILHLIVYSTDFSYATISNVMFVVGIILFLPALVAMTGAYQLFHGFRYVFRVFVSPNFRNEYPNFRDYKEERTVSIKTTVFLELLISSLAIVIVAIILAQVAMS